MADYLVQEDGTSRFVLEDSSGDILLEASPDTVIPTFIASATVLYAPQVAYTGAITLSTAGTFLWLCPAGITTLDVESFGGGGGANTAGGNSGHAGGGGGAFAERRSVPVTPGTLYTLTVGAGGAAGADGGDTTFTGDSSTVVKAKGGGTPSDGDQNAGIGGAAASSIGDSGLVFSGGNGGAGLAGSGHDGAGGGASGNVLATGASGSNAPGRTGGAGANGGGSGGLGGQFGINNAAAGSGPGGGGGGAGGLAGGTGGAGADGRVVIAFTPLLAVPFIPSVTVAYDAELRPHQTFVPFIPSVTVVYAAVLSSTNVEPDFIDSTTRVYVPNLKVAFTGGGVSQVALEVITQDNASPTADVTQVTLEIVVPNYKGLHVHERT